MDLNLHVHKRFKKSVIDGKHLFFMHTGGVILTYILLLFFAIELNFSMTGATLWCSLLGVILTLGLAFTQTVR